MGMDLFGRRPSDRGARRRVRASVIDLLGLDDGDSVTVTELSCSEPGCPPHETVVLIARTGQPTMQCKVAKPAADVVLADLEVAVALALEGAPHA